MKIKTVLTILLITIILIALGYLVAVNVHLMPEQAATRAIAVDRLFQQILGIAAVIFLLVEGLLIYAVIRFRRKAGESGDGEPIHGNLAIEIVWTLIPTLIVVWIAISSVQALNAIEAAPADSVVVEVIGRQFAWEFVYPESGHRSTELHLPVGQTARLEITSEDVIHSLWIPDFRAKRDATPGQISELLVTPTVIGVYPIRCAELCGAAHAAMNSVVIVESLEDFEAWLGKVREISLDPLVIFTDYGCGACHALPAAGATGAVGPSMVGIAERIAQRQLGVVVEDYLRHSILNPNVYIVEGFPAQVMPSNFGERLTAEQLEILVAYLAAQ